VTRSARVEDPLKGVGRLSEGNGVEGAGEGLKSPRRPSWRGRLWWRRRRVVSPRSRRRCVVGRQGVLWRGDARWGTTGTSRGTGGPHVNGPGPRVEEGGPLRAALHAALCAALRAALAASTAVTLPAAVARRGPLGRLVRAWGGRNGGRLGAGVLLDD